MSTVYGYFRPWQGKAFQRKSPLQKNALPAALQSFMKRGIEFERICRCQQWQCKLYRQVLTTTQISIFAKNLSTISMTQDNGLLYIEKNDLIFYNDLPVPIL